MQSAHRTINCEKSYFEEPRSAALEKNDFFVFMVPLLASHLATEPCQYFRPGEPGLPLTLTFQGYDFAKKRKRRCRLKDRY